eukprot:TsM_001165900 transcript=TsM_001165900 gene=TsM_001165900
MSFLLYSTLIYSTLPISPSHPATSTFLATIRSSSRSLSPPSPSHHPHHTAKCQVFIHVTLRISISPTGCNFKQFIYMSILLHVTANLALTHCSFQVFFYSKLSTPHSQPAPSTCLRTIRSSLRSPAPPLSRADLHCIAKYAVLMHAT